MRRLKIINIALLLVILGLTSACSNTNMKGVMAAFGDLDFSAERALLNAA